MPGEGVGQQEGNGDVQEPQLPSAREELDSAQPPPTPVDPERRERADEAAVRLAEIQAGQASDDRTLRRNIAEAFTTAVFVQVAIADVVFVIYGFWNDWHIAGGTMGAWLGATVVQVIAVALVVARSLFPSRAES